MSKPNMTDEIRDFYEFLLARVEHGELKESLDECVAQFHEYQEELSKCRADIVAAIEEQDSGIRLSRNRLKHHED
ncbi:hypothetical protein [Calycomorphotria hydatis]|uniref:hypothetical protein n=1 Tax=Calycomorphotria hydatis TaxID=2528027 RepID=UPI001E30A5C7|nr:hypothetical protein [Calycomorphotria hydatis]